MAYRKFKADRLFTGERFVDDGQVVVTAADGRVLDLIPVADAGEGLETVNGILSPGFINCHCHLELSHLKGVIPEGTGMISFLLSVMGKRNYPREEILAAISDAEAMMVANGIVGVGDIVNTADTLAQKRSGNCRYYQFVEALGAVPAAAAARFGQARSVFEAFRAAGHKDASIVPHAPYSVSRELFGMIDAFDRSALLTIHNQESAAEAEFFLQGGGEMRDLFSAIGVDPDAFEAPGITSLQHYLPLIGNGHRLLLVHNVTTDKADLAWIQAHEAELPQLYLCLCPNANLYINGMLPDIELLSAAYTDSIVIGTDSLASNHQLDILSELRTIQRFCAGIQLDVLLRWATSNGARALGWESELGTIAKGKNPGLILISNIQDGLLTNARVRRLI